MNEVQHPNVVFVLTDDQGYGDLGCHGNDVVRTPNINRLHSESIRFTDYHVGSTCAPTRAGILTGHYCNSAGVWHTIGGRSLLREDEWTLADALRANGYRTGHFGKWHLGDTPPFRPHERGFHYSVSHAGGGIGNTGDAWGNDYFDDTYFVNGEPRSFQGYCTDVFFREGRAFIERHADEPFFCYIATNAPHGPLNVELQYVEPYRDVTPHEERARFYGMITNIDDNVGVLMEQLENLGLSKNTILVFMTDNGTANGVELDGKEFPREGPGSFNAGMRGCKGSAYEGGHRVPFFLCYPAENIAGGVDVTALTSYVDFMPTLLELCGIDIPAERSFHGRSLLPLIRRDGAFAWDERVVVCDTQRIARPMKWRQSAVMQGRWRLVDGSELYDVARDPGQKCNIAESHPAQVESMRSGYDTWWQLISAQFERDVPTALGVEEQIVKLTTHDIRNESCAVAWNQRQVREGIVVSGFWEVDVRCRGRYEIELRRWPEETGYLVAAGIHGDDSGWRQDCIQNKHAGYYQGGQALDIRWAQISLGGKTCHAEVNPESNSTRFEMDLSLGPDRLYASFHDRAERSIAPYYVYVRRLSV